MTRRQATELLHNKTGQDPNEIYAILPLAIDYVLRKQFYQDKMFAIRIGDSEGMDSYFRDYVVDVKSDQYGKYADLPFTIAAVAGASGLKRVTAMNYNKIGFKVSSVALVPDNAGCFWYEYVFDGAPKIRLKNLPSAVEQLRVRGIPDVAELGDAEEIAIPNAILYEALDLVTAYLKDGVSLLRERIQNERTSLSSINEKLSD
jgi:hypothetical protein